MKKSELKSIIKEVLSEEKQISSLEMAELNIDESKVRKCASLIAELTNQLQQSGYFDETEECFSLVTQIVVEKAKYNFHPFQNTKVGNIGLNEIEK